MTEMRIQCTLRIPDNGFNREKTAPQLGIPSFEAIAIPQPIARETETRPPLPTCPPIERHSERLMLAARNPYIAVLTRVFDLYDLKMRARAGVVNHGICEKPRDDDCFSQSVVEHSYMVAETTILTSDYFTEVRESLPPDAVKIALTHDYGEKYLGDSPDDKSLSEEGRRKKDEFELAVFTEFMRGIPEWSQLRTNFAIFQTKLSPLYLLDKFEFITYLAWTTMHGRPGSLAFKRAIMELTDQDKHNISVCGSERTIDVMVVHFVEHSVRVPCRDVFLGLIEQIYLTIDGRIPDWYLTMLKN